MKFSNEIITARNNPTVKWASSLKDKKGRESEGVFIAEGEKLTYEAIGAHLPVTHIFVAESKAERILPRLKSFDSDAALGDVRVITLADGVFALHKQSAY